MYHLAIDIGASSGRHIVGWRENGALKTQEVYRFPNGVTEREGHLAWDMERLFQEVKAGVKAAFASFPDIASLSIDTWGVDYVLLRGDREVWPCYAYRDSRTEAVISAVHEKIPFDTLYRHTGCQFQPFNTIYQLGEGGGRNLPGRPLRHPRHRLGGGGHSYGRKCPLHLLRHLVATGGKGA